jgi:hypothetical protein
MGLSNGKGAEVSNFNGRGRFRACKFAKLEGAGEVITWEGR